MHVEKEMIKKCISGAMLYDLKGEAYIDLADSPNFNCDCYSCQCDGGCDCVCQQSCDAGPCYS